MPKPTAFKKMTKAEKAAYLASLPKPAPAVKPDRVIRVAKASKPVEPSIKDGLIWLHKKRRLSDAQVLEGFRYRDLFREVSGVSIKSGLEAMGMGGGGSVGGGLPGNALYGDAAKQLELFVIQWNVLQGQNELLTVMNGVCGLGHTVRYLAGDNQLRAAELEAALRIALDMLIANRNAKAAAREKFKKAA